MFSPYYPHVFPIYPHVTSDILVTEFTINYEVLDIKTWASWGDVTKIPPANQVISFKNVGFHSIQLKMIASND